MVDPYDELPYRTYPIEWTAPERLVLASVLHGGPRAPIHGYRVLELGCADGANLLPMAWFRRHADFVGIDGARSSIDAATQRAAALGLTNVRFVHADFAHAHARIDGEFDFVLAHGVLSWIAPDVRDALLQLCAQRLRPGGLLYLNYNTQPGWSVRGMVRDFLLAQTAGVEGLRVRAEAAQAVCRTLAEAMDDDEAHPWRRLMAGELRLVRDGHVSYVAHEYLAPENHAYWRGELLARLASHGLAHVADADFDQPWARQDEGFCAWLHEQGIAGRGPDDTEDLLRYRQLHSPILTRAPLARRALDEHERSRLRVASCLTPRAGAQPGVMPIALEHPSGYEVEVRDEQVAAALVRLAPLWPRSVPLGEAFADPAGVLEDLQLLHRNGLVRLRCVEPDDDAPSPEPLHRLEAQWGGYRTTALHEREAATP